MTGLLGIPLGEEGSGRARYAQAMALYAAGQITAAQLEAYRVAAAADASPPGAVLADRGLPLPGDPEASPALRRLRAVEAVDRYLARLSGPGIAEARAGIAVLRLGQPCPETPQLHPVAEGWLGTALESLALTEPALALRLLEVAPHLAWRETPIEGAARDQMARARLAGSADFAVDLWLAAPHALCPDHSHPAPELCVPLTGLQVWRFGTDRPLQIRRAHVPVWIEAGQPHLVKAGGQPLLCLCIRTCEVDSQPLGLPAADWPSLQDLRL